MSCGDCDFCRSPPSAYKIADIWHIGYRRLNPPAVAESARSRDFLLFPQRVASKINQSRRRYITWLFKTAEDIENCFWTEEKEVNLITLWSERPWFFYVTSSDCGNRLKNEIQVFDHIFLRSHFSERFLERFSCKIMAAANNFFLYRCRHFVCLHWFTQFLNVTRWNLESRLK